MVASTTNTSTTQKGVVPYDLSQAVSSSYQKGAGGSPCISLCRTALASSCCPRSRGSFALRHRIYRSANSLHWNRGKGCKSHRNRDRRLQFCAWRTGGEEGVGWRGRRHGYRCSLRQCPHLALGSLRTAYGRIATTESSVQSRLQELA